jgi:hypothetical protein
MRVLGAGAEPGNGRRLFQKCFGHAKILVIRGAIGSPPDLRLYPDPLILNRLSLVAAIFIGDRRLDILGFCHDDSLTVASRAR